MIKESSNNPIYTSFGIEEKHLLQECIHCGFCLPTCPTYSENGKEMDSPRGRLYLMEAAMNGEIDISERFFEHIDLCLVCRACETACPSGVQFGKLMEITRDITLSVRDKSTASKLFSNFILSVIIPSHRWLSTIFKLGWLYQKTGLHWVTKNTFMKIILPTKIRNINESIPPIPFKRFAKNNIQTFHAIGEKKGRVALFTGCVMDHLFPNVHAATIRILNWNGYEVVIPSGQTCCGALHVHSGDSETSELLKEINLSAFSDISLDSIIVNAAGCGAQLKQYKQENNKNDPTYPFTKKVKDLTEFLATVPLHDPEFPLYLKVVYDEPCHLLHGQGISVEPKQIIKSIPGITLLSLIESDTCCGSAGSYSITETEMSLKVLERKINHIVSTGADCVVSANPGCQIQLQWGMNRKNLSMEVLHIAELLDRAYQKSNGYPIP